MDRLKVMAMQLDPRWIRVGWIVMALALAAIGLSADDDWG